MDTDGVDGPQYNRERRRRCVVTRLERVDRAIAQCRDWEANQDLPPDDRGRGLRVPTFSLAGLQKVRWGLLAELAVLADRRN